MNINYCNACGHEQRFRGEVNYCCEVCGAENLFVESMYEDHADEISCDYEEY